MLPVSGVGDPFAAQRMPTHMRIRAMRKNTRTGCPQIVWELVATIEDKGAAIGLGEDPFVHYRDSPASESVSIASRPLARFG